MGITAIPTPAGHLAATTGDGDQAMKHEIDERGLYPMTDCIHTAATGRPSRRRSAHCPVRGLLTLLLGSAALLLSSAPASALLNQGHVFSGTFEGSGAQSFEAPSGVAVNEASGDVYVADPAHERVERFKSAGGGYEVCRGIQGSESRCDRRR